jgi:predicted nucleic acid-binding protein
VKLLLDTCVLSEIRTTDGSPAVKAFIASVPAKALLLSVITVGEITKGVALLPDGQKKRELDAWRIGLSGQFADRILPLDHETAEIWGELTAAGLRKGVTIPAADGLIAATAMRHGLLVATRNTPHFNAAGIMVVNPWECPAEATADPGDAPPRQGGSMKGKIWVAEDFDAPDPEIEKVFSGDKP